MWRKLRIVCIILTIALTMASCSEEPTYDFQKYSTDEVIAMINDNEELFNELVRVLVEDDDFYVKGRRRELDDAFLGSPYDEQIELLDTHGQQVIHEFFQLKPYMISYEYSQRYIDITFIGDVQNIECYVFLYWIDKQDTQGLQEFLHTRRQRDYTIITSDLPEGWCMFYK